MPIVTAITRHGPAATGSSLEAVRSFPSRVPNQEDVLYTVVPGAYARLRGEAKTLFSTLYDSMKAVCRT